MPESPVSPPGQAARRLSPPIRDDDPGSGRVRAIDSHRPASPPRPTIQVDDPVSEEATSFRGSGSCKSSSAANKELQEAENEIQRLNELRLGEDISYEEYLVYLQQLPDKPDVDTSTELDAVQLKELQIRHVLYLTKYYQLSQQVPEYDKWNEDYPPGRLGQGRFLYYEEDGKLRAGLGAVVKYSPLDQEVLGSSGLSAHLCGGKACLKEIPSQTPPSVGASKHWFRPFEEDGKFDWSFHPDYCKLAGLEDYQRLVPRNYGGYEYVDWDEYRKYFHSYEVEQEYIKYCEELSKKLKWMEAYVPNKSPSLKWGRILTRGTYQAIKIATDFSKITGGLAFSGFYEWLDSMSFDVCSYNEFDGVYYEIWQRYSNEKKFRDALDEVYDLNRFPLRQDRMRSALENDTFCSDLEEEFLACTTCLKEFAEDKAQISEEKARELIAEALRKETQKPKFYEEYCKKKIDIARAIGLISS